jgi:hypothetical protein
MSTGEPLVAEDLQARLLELIADRVTDRIWGHMLGGAASSAAASPSSKTAEPLELQERLRRWLQSGVRIPDTDVRVCDAPALRISDIASGMRLGQLDRKTETSVGTALLRLGWDKHRAGSGAREYWYRRPQAESAMARQPRAAEGSR